MAALLLNDIQLPIITGVQKTLIRIGGERFRTFSGQAASFARGRKAEWSIKTAPLTKVEALAWTKFLHGEGQSWTFDVDLYSSKGQAPTSSASASLATTGPAPRFGAKRLATTGGVTQLPMPSSSEWTVLLWVYSTVAGSWVHYGFTSAGQYWANGSTQAGPLSFGGTASVSAGSLSLQGSFDEVHLLPFVAPPSWMAAMTSDSALQPRFGALPNLTATGSMIGGTMTVRAEVTGSQVVTFINASGVLEEAGEQLEITLYEV